MDSKHRRKKDAFDRTLELSATATSLAERMQSSPSRTHCLLVMRGLDVGSVIRMTKPSIVIGRDESCDVILSDEGISRRHARFTLQNRNYAIEDLGSTNGVYINGTQVSSAILAEGDKILLGRFTILKYSRQDELELEFQKRIHESASIDGLTGALNRRSLETRLEAEWSFSQRHGTELNVIMFDVDYFKRVNDTYGHSTGDEVLRAISEEVLKTIRMEDLFGRYGGEEFILVVRGIGHQGAVGLAERIREMIERLELRTQGHIVPVTISLGVSTASDTTLGSPEELIKLADERLYKAKQRGRNRVVGEQE